jgi:hypothetical protein
LFAVFALLGSRRRGRRAFRSDKGGAVAGHLVLSLLSFAAGVVALAWPGITALVLTIWVAAWALTTGVVEVALAFRRGAAAGQRAMWALGGLLSVALGVVLAIRPDIGAVTLATVFGLFSIFYGVQALMVSTTARGASAPRNVGWRVPSEPNQHTHRHRKPFARRSVADAQGTRREVQRDDRDRERALAELRAEGPGPARSTC